MKIKIIEKIGDSIGNFVSEHGVGIFYTMLFTPMILASSLEFRETKRAEDRLFQCQAYRVSETRKGEVVVQSREEGPDGLSIIDTNYDGIADISQITSLCYRPSILTQVKNPATDEQRRLFSELTKGFY